MGRSGALAVAVVAVAVVATGLLVTAANSRAVAVASEAVQPTSLATVPGRVYAVAASARYVVWRGCDSVGSATLAAGDSRQFAFPSRPRSDAGCWARPTMD